MSNKIWSVQVESRVPEGTRASEMLKWDLQSHGLTRPIGGRIQIYMCLRRERPQAHFLPGGALRQDAPLWAPLPQCLLNAIVPALKSAGVLAENCQIAGINIEATWAPQWDVPGYSLEVLPADKAGEDPATCRYARQVLKAEVGGRLSFVRPTKRRAHARPLRWTERLVSAVMPYYNFDRRIPDGPLAVRIRVVRQPGRLPRPDVPLIAGWVFYALQAARIIRADLVQVSEVGVRIESGDEPRTEIEVWRLPEFGRQISAA